MAVPKEAANSNSSAHRRRRLTTDRTEYSRRRPTTRNVRTSSMPGNPTNQTDDGRSTIDEAFSDSYKTAGIQPQGLGSEPAQREKYQQPKQIDRSARVVYKKTMQGAANVAQNKIFRKKKVSIKKKFSQRRAVVVTGSIWAWAWPSYIAFQLPIAIIGLVLFGAAGGISSLVDTSLVDQDVNDGFFVTAIKGVGGYFFSILEAMLAAATALINFNPLNLFLIPILLLFVFGMLVLFTIYFIYKVNLLNPLSGNASGMKLGVLLLAIIGYSLPFLNLFPWFFIWTLVVLRYPN